MYTLENNGFIHYQSTILPNRTEQTLLHNEFSLLEKDQYAPKDVLRYRRYANCIIHTWSNELFWLPTIKNENGDRLSGYDQGGNNPEHNNIRYFNALSEQIKNTDFLKNLIIDDFSKTIGLKQHYLPIYVGVHFVKVCCINNSFPGFSSPDCFHQDGEPFTFAHLVYRNDFTGRWV